MLGAYLITAVIIVIVDMAFWLIVLRPIYVNWGRWNSIPEYASAIFQITVVGLLAEAILFSAWSGILSPPLALLFDARRIWEFREFSLVPVTAGLLAAAFSFFLWRSWTAKFRRIAWGLSATVFCGATFLASAQWSDYLQTAKISEFAPDCFVRHSFWHSVRTAGEDTQILAIKDGKPYGWSFKQLDFYLIPPTVVLSTNCK